MGFDALLETECPPGRFLLCCGQGRILLTRTRRIIAAHPECNPVWIRANDPFEQMREVLRVLGITARQLSPFSRCLRCNLPIETIGREEARADVPDYVWQTQSGFSRCPRCLRTYWAGTHTARGRERIKMLFDGMP